jgi:GNAT superfamily N-acetyltransferase
VGARVAVALSWESWLARAGVETRAATGEDLEFGVQALEASMRESVEAAYGGWDDAEQRTLFSRSFDLASHRILRCDGADAGVLAVEPRVQRRGIGTSVVRGLLDAARARTCPLELSVLRTNPAAFRFYERLGFQVVGETPTHWMLEAE